MSSEFSDQLKDNLKKSVITCREQRKGDALNKCRKILESSDQLNQDIPSLVSALKAHGTESKVKVLTNLKKIFYEKPSERVEFLKIEGALHCLVGLILGKDPFIQINAVECCCNLSLGDAKTCFQVAKAGGPYFMSCLQGFDFNLINVVLLTVGNLCCNDLKIGRLFLGHGILAVLQKLSKQEEVRENALYALLQVTRAAICDFKNEDIIDIVKTSMSFYAVDSSAQWLALEVSYKSLNILCAEGAVDAAISLYCRSAVPEVNSSSIRSATAAVRLISNLAVFLPATLKIMTRWSELFDNSEAYFHSNYRHLTKETLWMFANILCCPEISPYLGEIQDSVQQIIRTAALKATT